MLADARPPALLTSAPPALVLRAARKGNTIHVFDKTFHPISTYCMPMGAVRVMLSCLHVMTRIDHADTHTLIPMRIHIQGEECLAAACVTCTQCNAEYYKVAVSTEACGLCPVNTYGNEAWG